MDMLQYKCPNCGSPIEFDSTTQKMKCPYCNTELDVQGIVAESEALPADQFDWQSDHEDATYEDEDGLYVYVCASCGGEVLADKTTGATICPYCDNNVVLSHQFTGSLKPNRIIPFKYNKQMAKEALKSHYKGKYLLPKAFKTENHIDEIKGLYVPFWTFDATCDSQARYRATRVRTWQDHNWIYTETNYYNIHRAGSLSFKHIPVDGASKMDNALMDSVEPFNFEEAVDFNTAYLAGYLADKYDEDAATCFPRANARIISTMDQELRRTIIGYSTVMKTSQQTSVQQGVYHYVLLPIWVLNTTYRNKRYVFAINGQTGKIVGNLPCDYGKLIMTCIVVYMIVLAILYFCFMMG